MVELETVLVLGAGASTDFGFPTGKKLVTQIRNMLSKPEDYRSGLFYETGWRVRPDAVTPFVDTFTEADPFSIDAWLEHNPDFIEVGKVAIAIALLEYEQNSDLRPTNNWYQLLFQRLDSPFEEFQDNKLSIITFNYDRSLEQYLFENFRYTHTNKSKEECRKKLNQLKICHVYGSLGRLEWKFDNPEHPLPQVHYGAKLDQNYILCAADSIKIVPEKTTELSQEFQEARELIYHAKALYFLGFGYNETNMKRLGIDILRKPSKIMGTAYELDYQRIKEIERLNIHTFTRNFGLINKPVYEFLYNCVDFNDDNLPDILFQKKSGNL